MKKLLSTIILGVLISQIAASFIVISDISTGHCIEKETICFDQLSISNTAPYLSVQHDLATSYTLEPGEPVLPVVTKTYRLPIGSTLTDVSVQYAEKETLKLEGLIRPAPQPVIDGSDMNGEMPPSLQVYESKQPYPPEPFTYDVKIGLDGTVPTMFVSVHCYPVTYVPIENLITTSQQITVSITYQNPSVAPTTIDESDLLIIAPSAFTSSLQDLVSHKNSVGMKTTLVSLEDIYASGVGGRDNAETIKLYIKQSVETMGITYVMLVGGHKGQSNEWYVPVRYGHSQSEEAYLSDLYYADLYKYEDDQVVYEDWDSNGNGIVGEYSFFKKDTIDGAPDIYIGRLACRSQNDVDIIVNKIITYEQTKADESWFKHMLLIGGDTYPESPIAFEAEIDTNLSASHMEGFTFDRLWASTGALTGQADVEEAFSNGCGFIHMAGHANPSKLVTHPPFDKDKEIDIQILAMYDIKNLDHFQPVLTNGEKQPIVIVGGCHNSQYNTSLSVILDDIKEHGIKGTFFGAPWRFYYMEWVPKCFSWWLTIQENSGAIATFGNTGLGMGIWDYDYLTGLDGWLFPRFFYHYGVEGKEHIGMAQGAAIIDYVNEFDINKDSEDRQMIQQWALLGDPSLLAGGYE